MDGVTKTYLFGYSFDEWQYIKRWCHLNGIKYTRQGSVPDSPKKRRFNDLDRINSMFDVIIGCSAKDALKAKQEFEKNIMAKGLRKGIVYSRSPSNDN